ncbi:hypothetical protein J056_002280 [Wallemia ichthyophaga EXF-994]|uniref:Hydrophobin n=1 Tax=Wallemia ichthyophaga (strain EXF-994 / CBS 113033) TaxID=1299270 RepID=R9APR4_WALI9|nr:uncharacterized protein J056_002280 [Wallemia ichthyophaga EXF-994]EOR04202.1 hypothetical protein J056_002280 [Wallemia ichthyophaga EXF-994]
MIAQTVFAAALVASVSAGWESKTGSCNTGKLSCCDLNKKVQKSTGEESGLLHTGDVLDQRASKRLKRVLETNNSTDECKNTPTCCEDVKEDGLVGVNCTPISLV